MTVVTYTVNGIVAAYSDAYWTGIDGSGLFGPVGASLVGDHFWTTWTVTDCQCIGAASDPLLKQIYPLPNPVLDVTLQIGTQPYGHNPVVDFGGGSQYTYGEVFFSSDSEGLSNWLQMGDLVGGGRVIANGGDGSTSGFNIGNTSGLLTHTAIGIPAPDLGSGLVGSIATACLLLVILYRRRRNA